MLTLLVSTAWCHTHSLVILQGIGIFYYNHDYLLLYVLLLNQAIVDIAMYFIFCQLQYLITLQLVVPIMFPAYKQIRIVSIRGGAANLKFL